MYLSQHVLLCTGRVYVLLCTGRVCQARSQRSALGTKKQKISALKLIICLGILLQNYNLLIFERKAVLFSCNQASNHYGELYKIVHH